MKNNPLEQRSGCSGASVSVVSQCFHGNTQGSPAIQKIPDTLRRLGRLCPFAGSLPPGWSLRGILGRMRLDLLELDQMARVLALQNHSK